MVFIACKYSSVYTSLHQQALQCADMDSIMSTKLASSRCSVDLMCQHGTEAGMLSTAGRPSAQAQLQGRQQPGSSQVPSRHPSNLQYLCGHRSTPGGCRFMSACLCQLPCMHVHWRTHLFQVHIADAQSPDSKPFLSLFCF